MHAVSVLSAHIRIPCNNDLNKQNILRGFLHPCFLEKGQLTLRHADLFFCVSVYRACVQSGRLNNRAKHLFTKDPDVRTSEDIKELFRAVETLHCFSKYSRAVKLGLAKFVYYSEFSTGRVVVQQGKQRSSENSFRAKFIF